MKGFDIQLNNSILDPKHVENIGGALWLFAWLVDKTTNGDDTGAVLGGKPIKYPEVKRDLGISQDVYTDWIKRLLTYPYIKTKRTPYGTRFWVLKNKKKFKKSREIPTKGGIRFRQNPDRDSDKRRNVLYTSPVDYTTDQGFFKNPPSIGEILKK